MEGPLVSVLMTAYNREKYIGAAIQSVLASTYKNFELIIVDDCSMDRTVEIAKSFSEKDSRIKVFVNEKNLGQFANRNLAARLSSGKYLKYLDSDDLLYPTGLEVLVSMMEQFPEAGYGLSELDQDDQRVYPYLLTPRASYERHFVGKALIFYKAPLSSIIKKEAFERVGGYTNPSGEGDYEMWLLLAREHNVVLMPGGTAWYRVHDEQIDFQRRNNPMTRFLYYPVTLKYLTEGCPLEKEQAGMVIKRTQGEVAKTILMTFFRHSPSTAAKMYKLVGYNWGSFLRSCYNGLAGKLSKRIK